MNELKESIKVDFKNLPVQILIKGENGEMKPYVLAAAGRKFGACLQAPQMV